MEKILLIISIILFHLPLGFYKDTIRRYQRMLTYNPDKAFVYDSENGSLNEVSLNVILYFISSLVFALLPFIGGLGVNWIIAIILNLVASFYIVPFLVFRLYPANTILNKKTINAVGLICIVLGFVVFGFCLK